MQLQEKLRQWQDAMRLSNWDITAEMMPDAEYVKKNGPESNAQNDIHRNHFRSRITIRDDGEEEEYEFRLVHELTHLLLIELQSTAEHIFEYLGFESKDITKASFSYELEGAVHCVSRALLRVRDENKCQPSNQAQRRG